MKRDFSTRAIHAGYDRKTYHGALNPPLFLNSTFAFANASEGMARFSGDSSEFLYHRVGSPTVAVLERRLAELECGEAALATSSGMAAIAALLWCHLSQGDEIVADTTLYGCTHALVANHLPRLGVRSTLVDMSDPTALRAALTRRTRIALCETPANPTMRIADIEAIADICRENSTILVVDNTYATPYLQRPLEHGAHVVVHSATKYLGGHGDLVAGAIVSCKEIVDRARLCGVKEMTGGCVSSFDAFLTLRGIKTLALRMDRHCATAYQIAEALSGHASVARVFYPGLDAFEQHALAKRQMLKFGGMIAFELHGGAAAAQLVIDRLQLITRAVSLGSAETLVQHPASMTHSTYDRARLASSNISDGLLRLSVGLESFGDLWFDLKQSLDLLDR